jgi:two-component system phosphate regulon sensor histidine kinase PhoR
MPRSLISRLLLPQAIVIVVVCSITILGGAVGLMRASNTQESIYRGLGPLIWIGLFAGLGGIVAIAIVILISSRRQVWDVSTLFFSALPPEVAHSPALTNRFDDNLLRDIARTFSELMDDATKDQAQLITIISSMSDGLIALDHQQRILITNEAAKQLMEFRLADVRGRQLWEVVPLEDVLKAVTEVSLTGVRKTVSIAAPPNRYLDVTVTRLPLRPAGFIIVAHDVTETRRYEELRKEFVANVSHELRTPLAVIKGYVETLRDGAIDDRERAMQYLGTVERHTEQLTLLVDDLLHLSRLESSHAVPAAREVNLSDVVSQVAELMQPSADQKGHELIVDSAEIQPVMGNSEYLERAVSNLIENAIKYTPNGGKISITARARDSQAIIEVADNGIGIAAEDLHRIFERFYRVDRSRSREMGGTGLGLSIVKHVAQAHHGSVEVESTPGQGSTFRIKLPIKVAAAAPPNPA